MNWIRAVLEVNPKANSIYRAALVHPDTQRMLRDNGILAEPRRIAAFFATVTVESGYMVYLRENLNYSAAQISKVFGTGKHSAGISTAEAATLARKPEALAERVYGLGNPRKAKEFGHTREGEAFLYRGIGPFQNTGKNNIESVMRFAGVSKIEDLLSPENLFAGAIKYWVENNLQTLADRGAIRELRQRVNGGLNGYAEFEKAYNQILAMLNAETTDEMKVPGVDYYQSQLIELGYNIKLDGVYGPETKAAVKSFQKSNGLKDDGIIGPATIAMLTMRLEAKSPVAPPPVPVVSDETAKTTGGAAIGIGAAGELILSTAREIGNMNIENPLFTYLPPLLMVLGLSLVVWPTVRGTK